MALSPYRPTNVALRLSKPSEQWKLDLQELKILLLRRQYKQCATLSNELMNKLDKKVRGLTLLHAIHKAYLLYYGAASYETLGRAAHNYSSNKLLLLNVAKDGYLACKMSLADALEEFEKIDEVNEQFANGNEDFDPFKVEDSDIRPNLGNPNTWSPTRANTVFNLTEPWRTYARHKNRATKSFARSDERRAINVNMGSPIKYDAQVHDTGSSSTSSELMPLPLCIKKTRTRKPGFHGLIIPDQSILPLPLFSPSPLSPRNTPEFQTLFRAPKTSPMTAATTPVSRYKSHPSLKLAYPIENTPTKAWRSRKSLQPFINKISRESEPTSRMLSILASLSMQVDTNVSHLTTLIAETTELQRIHKANKNHRLASFWSFTPILSESQDSKADNTFNLLAGNGLNGTKSRNRVVSNGMESKQDRMARLRAEGWNTVGIKNPKRGWKGSEYYETICSEALAELYGC